MKAIWDPVHLLQWENFKEVGARVGRTFDFVYNIVYDLNEGGNFEGDRKSL